MEDLSGQRLGRYLLTRLVGRGGMASVYEAHDPTLDRLVAIKVLAAHLLSEADFLARFQHEARAVAALRHPAIVHMYDFGSQGALPYMVMELIDGPSLEAVLRDVAGRAAAPGVPEGGPSEGRQAGQPASTPTAPSRALPPDAVVRLVTAVGSALDYGHARGMVHRDVKPSNVLLTADLDPVLSDYGIARIAGMTRHTATGLVMGTVHYMAPEQAQGLPIDGRCDAYALAVVAFEALAGRVPYVGETTGSVLAQHITAPIPAATSLRPELPPAVDAVFRQALAKEPDDRYRTAGELAEALRDSLAVAPSDAAGPLLPAAVVDQVLSAELRSSLRTRPDVAQATAAATVAAATGAEATRAESAGAGVTRAEGAGAAVAGAATRLEAAGAATTGAAMAGAGFPGAGAPPATAGFGGATAPPPPPVVATAPPKRHGSPLRWVVIAAAIVVIQAGAVVGLVWKPWESGDGAGGAVSSPSPSTSATSGASASPSASPSVSPSASASASETPTASPSPSPSTSPVVVRPVAVAVEDVVTTPGVLARCPFIVNDDTSKYCKVKVFITDASGSSTLKVYGTRADYWWATNVKDAQNFTCTLPAGTYRWYLIATTRDGRKSEPSNTRKFVVQ